MGAVERDTMEARLAGMTQEQKDALLLQLAEGMRPGDDDQGRGRVQSAEAILALRPKVEVHTLMPTGRIDKRTQDMKVWETPGVLDPLATEDQPGRPQIVKVIDMRDGRVLFERDTVMGQPQPGQPVTVYGQAAPQATMALPQSDDDLAARLLGLLPRLLRDQGLRQAIVKMADDAEDAGTNEAPIAVGMPPLSEADARKTGPKGPTKRQQRREEEEAAMAVAGAPDQ